MDGESLGEGLLNLDHVCMITRNDEDTLSVVHFSVRRNRDEFNQCCYVQESVEEIYALAAKGYSSTQLDKMTESRKKKVEEAGGMPFYN
jgi:hypothetical protein